ncbi:MetQ/NlpA family ABC transporter substrate-binding protein [Saccharopolyspora rosea]|uniref:Lipoprotein n=1 Tax=Saccharopolyspora rosea TaxID=524884 RepID=A0ABW3FKU6_9PSEU|nr:MetQ/NlpA family ABC transporter substrate-binding protein [Saccharopolyspora rosea]
MRFRLVAAVAAAALSLAGCSGGGTEAAHDPHAPLKIGVSPTPHGEILQYVEDNLAKQAGIDLELEKFDDYNRPNEALAHGELDANYFQHQPYLQKYQAERGGDFVWVEPVHLEPLGIHSKKYRSVQEIPAGGRITLPNDPSNQARALKLLESQGLIKLKPGAGENATVRDVAENPKNIKLETLAADQLPRSVDDADAAVVNGNYAIKAGLTKPIAVENAQGNPYANGLVTTPKMAKDPRIAKLAELLRSPQVKNFINAKYGGVAVIPAS